MRQLLKLISFRYALTKKTRMALVIWGISLGVAMILGVDLANRSILDSYHRLLNAEAGKADLQVMGLSDSGLPESLMEQVSQADGVKHAAPVIKGRAIVASGHEKTMLALVFAVDPKTETNVRSYAMLKGALPGETAAGIALTKDLADSVGVNVGDSISLVTPFDTFEYPVTGILDVTGPGSANNGKFAVMELKSGQEAFGKEGLLDSIDLVLRDGADEGEVKAKLVSLLEGKASVDKPVERGQEVQDILLGLQFMLRFAAVMSVFVGLFMIFNNIMVGIEERRAELGILRCLGMQGYRCFAVVMVEALLLGVIGSVIGIGLGIVMGQVIAVGVSSTAFALFDLKLSAVTVSSWSLLKAFGYGVAGTLVAAYIPARETLAVQPIEAVRPAAVAGLEQSPVRRAVSGGILLVTGTLALLSVIGTEGLAREQLLSWGFTALVVAGVGLVAIVPELISLLGPVVYYVLAGSFRFIGRLAFDNLRRARVRNGATIAGLGISLAFLVGLSGYATSYSNYTRDWVDRTLAWDLRVSTGINTISAAIPLTVSLTNEIGGLEGVALASPQRFVFSKYGENGRILVSSFRMRDFPKYASLAIESGPAQAELAERMAAREGIAITTVTARRYALRVGDNFRIETPAGVEQFPILAVVDAFSLDTGEIYIDYDWYSELWKDTTLDAIAVKLTEGASAEQVTDRIKQIWPSELPVEVDSRDQWRGRAIRIVDEAFLQVKGLVAATVAVAAIGIANTMLLSVNERRREIASLRALGARQTKVLTLILSESFGIGVYGSLIGTAVGLGLYRILMQWMRAFTHLNMTIYWPVEAVVSGIVIALTIAPLAGFWAARRAAQVSIAEGLRHE